MHHANVSHRQSNSLLDAKTITGRRSNHVMHKRTLAVQSDTPWCTV
jgi:hypothetical protein